MRDSAPIISRKGVTREQPLQAQLRRLRLGHSDAQQPIAASRHRLDQAAIRAQPPRNHGDVNPQGSVIGTPLRPDAAYQIILCDQCVGRLDRNFDEVACLGTEWHVRAGRPQLASGEIEPPHAPEVTLSLGLVLAIAIPQDFQIH